MIKVTPFITQSFHLKPSPLPRNLKVRRSLSTSDTIWVLFFLLRSAFTSYGMESGPLPRCCWSRTSFYLSPPPTAVQPRILPSLTGGRRFHSTPIKPTPTSPAPSSSPENILIVSTLMEHTSLVWQSKMSLLHPYDQLRFRLITRTGFTSSWLPSTSPLRISVGPFVGSTTSHSHRK